MGVWGGTAAQPVKMTKHRSKVDLIIVFKIRFLVGINKLIANKLIFTTVLNSRHRNIPKKKIIDSIKSIFDVSYRTLSDIPTDFNGY